MRVETFRYEVGKGWSMPLPRLDSEHTLVIAFAAKAFGADAAPLMELQRGYPRSYHIGCSTSGEIHGRSVTDDSISVAVCRFERSRLRSAFAHVGHPDESRTAGRSVGEQLFEDDLRGVLVLSDGLRVNGSQLVTGLNDALPPHVVVTGGLAGDGSRFHDTWTVLQGPPRQGIVGAIGFYGESVRLGHGSKGGWDFFGPERRVTRSRGNVLYEIDGKPALDLYKEYLGDRANGLPATALLFPLAVRAERGDQKLIVRTILAVDDTQRSMTFAGDIPEGCSVQLMRANVDRLIEGACDAATGIGAEGCGESTLSIAISCVGRRLVLGERTEDEVEAVLEALPRGTRQIGFYSYGEISPYATGSCDLHNQTMTLTTISET